MKMVGAAKGDHGSSMEANGTRVILGIKLKEGKNKQYRKILFNVIFYDPIDKLEKIKKNEKEEAHWMNSIQKTTKKSKERE